MLQSPSGASLSILLHHSLQSIQRNSVDRVPISADGRHCCGHGVEDCLLRRFNDSLIQRIHPMISKHRNGKSSIVRPTWNCVSRRKSNYKFTAANGTWRPGASKAVCYPLGKLRQLTMYHGASVATTMMNEPSRPRSGVSSVISLPTGTPLICS